MSLRGYVPAGIGLATLTGAASFLRGGNWFLALVPVLLGAAWFVTWRREWRPGANLALIGLTLLAVASLRVADPSFALAMASQLGALLAWSMAPVAALAGASAATRDAPGLGRRVQRRIWTTLGIGAGLAILATAIRLDLGFWTALLLAVVAAAGLSRALTHLRTLTD